MLGLAGPTTGRIDDLRKEPKMNHHRSPHRSPTESEQARDQVRSELGPGAQDVNRRLNRVRVGRRLSWIGYLSISWVLASSSALSQEWPQILGPTRNGVAEAGALPQQFPAGGPRIRWRYELGSGYAGPAISGGAAFVFHRQGQQAHFDRVDLGTGKARRLASFATGYQGRINPDDGPRCVPLLSAGVAYLLGPSGRLHAVELQTGKVLWTRDLYGDYRGDEGYFGAGSTPLAIDGKILVNVGGSPNAGIVALDAQTGKTVWTQTREGASYASPTTIQVGGRTHVLLVTRLSAIVLDPSNGQVLARIPFGKRGPTVNAATPLVDGSQLFLSASYGVGAKRLSYRDNQLVLDWESQTNLASQYATAVLHEGTLYGSHGREDLGDGELQAVDWKTGELRWREPNFPISHVLRSGSQLLLVTIEGRLILAQANPTAFRKLSEASPLGNVLTRALPALAPQVLVLRTNTERSGGELVCLELGKPDP